MSAEPTALPPITERLIGWLRTARVPFRVLHHPPVLTSAEAATVRSTPLEAGAKAFERVLLALAKGTRPITLARPGHVHMTHDELSLLALFASAQSGDEARCLAHARWLMGKSRPEPLYEAVADLGKCLARNGRILCRAPDTVPPQVCAGKPVRLQAL